MLTKKILVPLDGSELAERVLVHARRFLHAPGARVTLLRVVPQADELESAALVLEEARERLEASGACATARVVVGEPGARIAQVAGESGASLVVLSTHGRSGVARAVLGSVAEEVLRLSPVPVLIANPLALGTREELPIRKVLVAMDGSTPALALAPAVEIARLHGAELVILHSVDVSWSHYPPPVARPRERAFAEAFTARELERLDVRARSLIVEGPPADRILAAVESEKADLLAITSHGRSGVARWYHGSTADSVIRGCRCPVLVVRTAEDADARAASESAPAIASP